MVDEIILRTIETYKVEGWRIEKDFGATSLTGVGEMISPRGNAFSYETLRSNQGFPDWEVIWDEDIVEAREFKNIFELIQSYYQSCYLEQGMERLWT